MLISYELGEFKEIMSPETELSDRALAYRIIKKLKAFWGIVREELLIEDYSVKKLLWKFSHSVMLNSVTFYLSRKL